MPWFGGTRSVTIAGAVMSLPRPSHTFLELLKEEVAKEPRNTEAFGVLFRLVPWASYWYIIVLALIFIAVWWIYIWSHFLTNLTTLHKEMESIFEGEDASQYASSSEHWQAGPKGPLSAYRHQSCRVAAQEAQLAALRAVQQLEGGPWRWLQPSHVMKAFCHSLEESGRWGNSFVKHVLFEGCTSYPYCSVNWVILSIFNPFKQ